MRAIVLEIRDRATFIPALAIGLRVIEPTENYEATEYLLRRCGYPTDRTEVMLTRLSGEGKATTDPYCWCDRTWTVAHDYICRNWQELEAGDVIDVEFILGETKEKKLSERIK